MTQTRAFLPRTLLTVLFLCSLWPLSNVQADAQLMVAPSRVVLEGRDRTAQIFVSNSGDIKGTYRITMVRKRMLENGEFQDIETAMPGEQFSDTMLRYSPRQVILEPGQSQAIRLQLRKPGNMDNGEYRSHLLFQAVPETKARSIESLVGGDKQEISIELTPILGITIPVIVRHGDTSADVSIDGLELIAHTEGNAPILAFDMKREGTRSVYGDLTAYFTPNNGDDEIVVGRANGVAVYTPNPLRHIRMSAQMVDGLQLTDGRLRVNFRQRPEDGGKILAESALRLQ